MKGKEFWLKKTLSNDKFLYQHIKIIKRITKKISIQYFSS